jgi:outer membrane protein insertion porin family
VRRVLLPLLLCLSACAGLLEEREPDLPREVVFVGSDPADRVALERRIAPLIADFVETDGALAYLDDAAFEVQRFHRELGYPSAEVSYERPEGSEPLTFQVVPGVRIAVGELELRGVDWLGRKAAEELLQFPEGVRDGSAVEWYTEAALRAGESRLVETYFEAGFLDAAVSPSSVSFDLSTGLARIELTLEPGQRYLIRAASAEGELDRPAEEVERELASVRGTPFTPQMAYSLRNRLVELYGNRGYPDATVRVEHQLEREASAADLALRIVAGPQVTIERVEIEGTTSIREDFVLDRLRLRPGDLYRRDKARESFERLYRTGLFERVAVRLEDSDAPRRALIVELLEAPSQELYFEPGYGSYELFRLKSGFRENNLFGTGRQFRLESVAAVRALSGEIGVSDPDFFDEDLLADLSFGAERREFPSFTRSEYTTTFSLSWPWTQEIESSVAYKYSASQVEDVQIVDGLLADVDSDVDVSSVQFSPRYDDRDSLLVPSRGTIANFGVEWAASALGSEIDFVRTTLGAAHYFALADEQRTVLAVGAELGWIVPAAATEEIPLQERFFNGGANTVRAFGQYELGPEDSEGNSVGGEGMTLFSIELRHRIAGSLHGALFWDVGSVALEYQDLTEFEGYAGGVGFGIRYMLPIGPLRADLAFNTDPGEGDDAFYLHVAVGLPF